MSWATSLVVNAHPNSRVNSIKISPVCQARFRDRVQLNPLGATGRVMGDIFLLLAMRALPVRNA
jgi:hypothetical protein